MSLVADTIKRYLPSKQKRTPSGWLSFNAVCCHHNGTTPDWRQRGGIKENSDGGISYHCFNCGFKTGWVPGRNISPKLRKLLKWLNVPDDEITKLSLAVLRENEGVETNKNITSIPEFKEVNFPKQTKRIDHVEEPDENFIKVLEYMRSRDLYLEDYDFYWSPYKDSKYDFRQRLIIPFRYNNKIVGWTARSIHSNDKIRYLSEQQPGYVFNLDNQHFQRKYCIVCEGPIDAIYVKGVALTGFELNEQKANLINHLNKETVLVPDRDREGKRLVEQAIDKEWDVSMPNWDDDIKDIGEAVMRYGRLYTMYSIIESIETTPLKIRLKKKKWF